MSTTQLDIVPDNLRNCVIKEHSSGSELYVVHSPKEHTGHTTISKGGKDGAVLATVHYHDMPVIPDTITLNDGEHHGKIKIRSWLKPATVVRSLPVHFEYHGMDYTVQLVNEKLALSPAGTTHWSTLEPIAVFEGSHHPYVPGDHSSHTKDTPADSTAHLTLQPAALDMQDEVVIALLVLAERIRVSGRMDGEPWTIVGPGAQIGL